ncbi:MAG: HigA family addiction module antitoxin [Burkholderiales bacterium]
MIEAARPTASAAAQILKVPRATLSNSLNGNAALSVDPALRLEEVIGADMNQLMRMQVAYDVAHTRRLKDIDVKRYVPA